MVRQQRERQQLKPAHGEACRDGGHEQGHGGRVQCERDAGRSEQYRARDERSLLAETRRDVRPCRQSADRGKDKESEEQREP